MNTLNLKIERGAHMNNDRFPAYQNMVAHMTPDQVRAAHNDYLKYYNANENDCTIVNMTDCDSFDKSIGLNCRYQLYWNTYIGWKVYMRHTGCFASDPRYE
jgi:superoxide dismutase